MISWKEFYFEISVADFFYESFGCFFNAANLVNIGEWNLDNFVLLISEWKGSLNNEVSYFLRTVGARSVLKLLFIKQNKQKKWTLNRNRISLIHSLI